MQFVFPTLAWGFLLVLVPLIVHLINLLRHRRQPWAAMEFLMESYRKHRRWVWLKQALLLMSRMAIMALLVAMLAQWISGSRWLAIFGDTITHHYVLLDDSFSMADSSGTSSAYQQGLSAITNLLRNLRGQGGTHQVTLVRYSRANGLSQIAGDDSEEGKTEPTQKDSIGSEANQADAVADLLARSIPADPSTLMERLQATQPSSLSVQCGPALRLIQPLIDAAKGQRSILYLVSDFRQRDWGRVEEVRSLLEQFAANNVKVELIDCIATQSQNLTVEGIEPDEDVLAAGVPVLVRVKVRNHGSAVARNVQVRVKAFQFGESALEPLPSQNSSGLETELPPLVIEQIAPGATESRRIQVLFGVSGWHAIEASLPDDSLRIDNSSQCVLHIEKGQKIALIDGDPNKRNAFFLDAALNPGGTTKTGLLTTRLGPEFLRDTTSEELSQFSCVLLIDVPRLDPRAVERLEEYVAKGGGVGVLFGNTLSQADYQGINQNWYRDGLGFMPVQLKSPESLPRAAEEGSIDIIPEQHPILQPLTGLSTSPFQFVRVSRFVAIEPLKDVNSSEPNQRVSKVVAKLRNGNPFLIDSTFKGGRVVVMLSGLSQDWTNWPQDPTFVVSAIKMVSYLGALRRQEASYRVGTPIDVQLPAREVLPEVQVVLPKQYGTTSRLVYDVNFQSDGESLLLGSIAPNLASQSEEIQRAFLTPGVLEFWSNRLQGGKEVRCFATNVAPSEGDLAKALEKDVVASLRPVPVRYRMHDEVIASSTDLGLSNRTALLMAILIAFMMFEQFLAWSASYHVPKLAMGAKS